MNRLTAFGFGVVAGAVAGVAAVYVGFTVLYLLDEDRR